jgi:hypothetical protein
MGKSLPVVECDDDDEQTRLNAHRAARRARLLDQDMGTGNYGRDVFSEPPEPPEAS